MKIMKSELRASRFARARAMQQGYRSGLEVKTANQITEAGITVAYETERLKYEVPSRISTYTPDFKFFKKNGDVFYVETKGLWSSEDRFKSRLIHAQYFDIDLRYVFSNENSKLYKGSPTTYKMYCIKMGWEFAHKVIPQAWLDECN